ncbi:S8 family serine peptidase [Melittangium boletus]|uniref:S8 family serine peptidase n=1 Tax=Melittangium boletus TaxID=83453 RepID=UPI003DA636F6
MIRRLALLSLLVLSACEEEEPTTPTPSTPKPTVKTGRVGGTLTPFRSSAALPPRPAPALLREPVARQALAQANQWLGAKRQAQTQALTAGSTSGAEAVPGDVLVRFEEARLTEAEALARVELSGYQAVHKGLISEHVHLIGYAPVGLRAMRVGETEELTGRVASQKGVRFAEKNVRVHAFATPNDPGYRDQWHYPLMNLPAAWDVTTGGDDITIAIVDSGIVRHPDLNARLVQGADVMRDAAAAGDGDGMDMDPTDVGKDLPNGGSSFHGTHVAGTIGAVSNEGYGVAGVTWKGKLVPVRALGAEGGDFADIITGVRWAAGLDVPGLQKNANPAKVINMSLGGEISPSAALQETIDEVTRMGVVIVVAAGNSNVDAKAFSPCNQQNVICVGATRFDGKRASYSNYGTAVHVMATGGETAEDQDGDKYPDGVLSTMQDKDKKSTWAYYQGTSMASPHVAGIVALMKAKNAALTTSQIKTIFQETADGTARCTEGCGAGLINAHTAVLRATGSLNTSAVPRLALGSTRLAFLGNGTRAVPVRNVGGGTLKVTAAVATSGSQARALSFPGGATISVPAYSTVWMPVAMSSSGLSDGDYEAQLSFTPESGTSQTVAVKFRVGYQTDRDAILIFLYEGTDGELTFDDKEGVGLVTAASQYAYSATLTARTYYVIAAIDDNGNNEIDDGDRVGYWRDVANVEPIALKAGQTVTGVNFSLVPTFFED